jgi:hypothetical protein
VSLFSQSTPLDEDAENRPDDEERVIDTLALKIVERRMAPVAILAVEAHRPFNYVASQAMIFASPILDPMVEIIFNYKDYDILRRAMERRSNVEYLILKIENYDAFAQIYDKKLKKFLKAEKKKWNWYQRWLGIATPTLTQPDDLKSYDWRQAARDDEKRRKPDAE